MTFSPIPIYSLESITAEELLGTCYQTVIDLRALHFRDADFPELLIEAADFWDMGLIAAGERNLSNSLDLARPLRSAAGLLARLPQVDVAQLLRHDLEAAARVLEKLTAEEAYNYSRYARDAFEPVRLQEIDAAFDRYSWVNETENAKQLVLDLYEIAARTLPIGDLFSFGASVEIRKTWLRDAVASLPDYAARRDDMDDWLPILAHQGIDQVKWPSNWNKVLFDLLAKRGLRRVGHQRVVSRDVV